MKENVTNYVPARAPLSFLYISFEDRPYSMMIFPEARAEQASAQLLHTLPHFSMGRSPLKLSQLLAQRLHTSATTNDIGMEEGECKVAVSCRVAHSWAQS